MPKCLTIITKPEVSMCKRYGGDRGVKDGTKNRTQPGRQTGPVGVLYFCGYFVWAMARYFWVISKNTVALPNAAKWERDLRVDQRQMA